MDERAGIDDFGGHAGDLRPFVGTRKDVLYAWMKTANAGRWKLGTEYRRRHYASQLWGNGKRERIQVRGSGMQIPRVQEKIDEQASYAIFY